MGGKWTDGGWVKCVASSPLLAAAYAFLAAAACVTHTVFHKVPKLSVSVHIRDPSGSL